MLAVSSLFDTDYKGKEKIEQEKIPTAKYVVIFMLMLPAIFLKFWKISEAGGVVEYLMSLAFRVVDLEGQGWIVVVFASVQIFYAFACYLFLLDSHKTAIKYVVFASITVFFLFVGLTSGSRSSLLMPLVTIIMIRHHLVKKIKRSSVVAIIALLLIFIAVYGAFRNDFGGSGFSAFSLEKLDFSHFHYGTNPIEILSNSNVNSPLFGETYFTLITNFVPRAVYPDKPDTGGLVFTKIYTGDQWEGMSNLAPGAFVEGIMNFGLIPGLFFGAGLTFLTIITSIISFRKTIIFCHQKKGSLYLKGFLFIVAFNYVLVAARFSYSEFTNVFFSFFLFVFFPALCSYFFTRIKVFK
jgi:oligosaccharide repeat unit polymerase